MKILVTGAAGFIGAHTVMRLCREGMEVTGIDSLNDYYDIGLKLGRLALCGIEMDAAPEEREKPSRTFGSYRFIHGDITDKQLMDDLFAEKGFDAVINLAAQAGVRYSLVNPGSYIRNNVDGFLSILECCRRHPVSHLLYASSSSVYGNARKTPFEESDPTDESVSLYAATKKSNELMAHTYSHLFRIPTTGMRFFTVYGPWGRPDMAYFDFTASILEGRRIQLFNGGDMYRDFTYVDDIVESILRLVGKPPAPEGPGNVPYRVLNLGNSQPVNIRQFLDILEEALGRKALVDDRPMQDTDVYTTYADTSRLEGLTGFSPGTDIREGLSRFVAWYVDRYKPDG